MSDTPLGEVSRWIGALWAVLDERLPPMREQPPPSSRAHYPAQWPSLHIARALSSACSPLGRPNSNYLSSFVIRCRPFSTKSLYSSDLSPHLQRLHHPFETYYSTLAHLYYALPTSSHWCFPARGLWIREFFSTYKDSLCVFLRGLMSVGLES